MKRNSLVLFLLLVLSACAQAIDRPLDDALFVVGKECKVRGLIRIENNCFHIRKPGVAFEYVDVPVAEVDAWCWLNPETCKKDLVASKAQLEAVTARIDAERPLAIEVKAVLAVVDEELRKIKEDAETLTLDELKAIVDKRLAAFKSDALAKRDERGRMILEDIDGVVGARFVADFEKFTVSIRDKEWGYRFSFSYGAQIDGGDNLTRPKQIFLTVFMTDAEVKNSPTPPTDARLVIGAAGTFVDTSDTDVYRTASGPIAKCFIYVGTEAFVAALADSGRDFPSWLQSRKTSVNGVKTYKDENGRP